MITINELLENIINGQMDPFKNKILEAFRLRDKNKNSLAFEQIQTGMKVKLVIAQKALQGAVGTVASKQGSFILVDLNKKVGEWHKGVSCLPGALEVIKGQ